MRSKAPLGAGSTTGDGSRGDDDVHHALQLENDAGEYKVLLWYAKGEYEEQLYIAGNLMMTFTSWLHW